MIVHLDLMGDLPQWAAHTVRIPPVTEALARLYKKCMKLVKYLRPVGEITHDQALDNLVRLITADQQMPPENTARVRINNCDGMLTRVEEDTIGGLGTDPVKREQFAPDHQEVASSKPANARIVTRPVPLTEHLKPCALLSEIANWANQLLQHPIATFCQPFCR